MQKRMREIAVDHELPELFDLAAELSRRPAVRRAAQTAPAMTDEIREAIRKFAIAYPDASYHEIAKHFDVNPGRVSEAIRGKRE